MSDWQRIYDYKRRRANRIKVKQNTRSDAEVKELLVRRDFYLRRKARLDAKMPEEVRNYRLRREKRIKGHFDAEEEEEPTNNKKPKGGHGNTRLPYGLAKGEGIDTTGMQPKDVWAALEGKGYSAGEAYLGLKEGKRGKELKSSEKAAGPKVEDPKVEEPELDYDTAKKRYEKARNTLSITTKKVSERLIEDVKRNLEKAKEWQKRYGELFGDMSIDDAKDIGNKLSEDRGDLHLKKEYLKYDLGEMKDKSSPEYKAKKAEYLKVKKEYDELDSKISALESMINIRFMWGDDYGVSSFSEKLKAYEKRNRDYDTAEENLRKARKELSKSVNKKFPTYKDCTTSEEVEEKANANLSFREGIESKFDGIHVEWARSTAESLNDLFTRYPVLDGRLGRFYPVDGLGSTIAQSYTNGEVELNTDFFAHKYKFKDSYDGCIMRGYHPQAKDPAKAVVMHEYGHQIDDLLSKDMSDELGGHSLSSTILNHAMEKFGKNKIEIKAMVSSYAGKGERNFEFLAEAWTSYLTSDEPNEVCKFVGQEMEKYINMYAKKIGYKTDGLSEIEKYYIRRYKRIHG